MCKSLRRSETSLTDNADGGRSETIIEYKMYSPDYNYLIGLRK